MVPPRETGNMQILLLGAAGMLLSALVLAWVATFCRLIPIPRVKRLIKEYFFGREYSVGGQ